MNDSKLTKEEILNYFTENKELYPKIYKKITESESALENLVNLGHSDIARLLVELDG